MFQICSELPLHTFYVVVYVIPAYFLAGLTVDVIVFFQVFGLLYLMIYCSRSLAMMSSAILPNFQLSCFFAQTFFSMFIMSAGFFINLDNIFSGKYKFICCSNYIEKFWFTIILVSFISSSWLNKSVLLTSCFLGNIVVDQSWL